MHLDLTRARNWDEIVALVAEAARKAPAGTWIVGRGWHQNKWDRPPEPSVDGCPTHDKLSRATPDHPVMLEHVSGHACFANARAMRLAGVEENTPDPPGMPIHRDSSGRPTGLFRESMALITETYDRAQGRRSPEEIDRYYEEAIRLAAAECLAKGITTLHDAGEPPAAIDRLRRLAESGRLPVRLWIMLSGSGDLSAERIERYRTIGACDNHLTVRAIKMFMDGALGTRDAWLLAPYDDKPGSVGWKRIGRNDSPSRPAGHRARDAALHPRHRRPRQPRGLERLRGHVPRASGQERPALADRACATPRPGRYSAFCPAWASSPQCRASTALPTLRSWSRRWEPAAPDTLMPGGACWTRARSSLTGRTPRWRTSIRSGRFTRVSRGSRPAGRRFSRKSA